MNTVIYSTATMQKVCRQCATKFEISDADLKFYDKISPVFPSDREAGDKKTIQVPSPTLCPDCRQQRRAAWRNERKLYHRKCDLCGQQIISIYSPDKKYTVYCAKCWWSDQWDAFSYGQKYDPSKSFFEQFRALQMRVPRLALYQKNTENSAFTNHTEQLRNCYLTVDTAQSENVYFSKWIIKSRDLSDCYQVPHSELTYESLYTEYNYNCIYVFLSDRSRDSAFLYDCKDCSDCFMCWNLKQKKYCIENKQYSKAEYEKIRKSIDLGSQKVFQAWKDKFFSIIEQKAIHKSQIFGLCENCSGDFQYRCKNVFHSYEVMSCEDSKFCYEGAYLKDCYDTYDTAFQCELQYDSHACNRGSNVLFGHTSYDIHDVLYVDSCHNSSNLFGCIGLKRKRFCILNRQYSQQEYEILVPKIIHDMQRSHEWGEFFPANFTPFAYNETAAQDYYPLAKKDALKLGFQWQEDDLINGYEGPKILIPDHIKNISEEITKQILICDGCKKNYRIVSQELKLYQKMNIPVPRFCHECRYKKRTSFINPRRLYARACMKCGVSMQTSYAPERKEIVYCEKCYLKEIY